MEEIWKDVIGYEGQYLISNFGRVKTLPRKVKTGIAYFRTIPEKIHKPCDNGKGYKYVCFRINGGKKNHKYIHRLVAESFLENPTNYTEVNHIDGNKENNSIQNLEWCNRSENALHAYSKGLNHSQKGEKNTQSKLTEENVRFIRDEYSKGHYTQKVLSGMFGICEQYVSNIIHHVKWKHVV